MHGTETYYQRKIEELQARLDASLERERQHLANASRAVGLLRTERVRNQQLVEEIGELRSLVAGVEQA